MLGCDVLGNFNKNATATQAVWEEFTTEGSASRQEERLWLKLDRCVLTVFAVRV